MSLEAILAAIHQKGETTVREIETRAQLECARILEEADREVAAIQAQATRQALAVVHSERARILQRASLEALKIVNDAQQAVVDRVLGRVRERLSGLRAGPAYANVLRNLLVEALETLAGSLLEAEQVHVQADPRDRDLIGPLLNELGVNPVVAYELDTWGGVQVMSPDRSVVVDNTLETRLDEATDYLNRFLPTLIQPAATAARNLPETEAST